MSIKIAHASMDENQDIKKGKAGDQTTKEVCIRTWYSKPWQYVIRFKNKEMREKVAYAMERACNNDNIGYDQSQRNTLLINARNVGYDPGLVTTPCETDCSALVVLACIYAGIPESSLVSSGNSATTSTLRKRLVSTGEIEVFNENQYIESDDYLLRGDILLREGSHVVVAIENGSKSDVSSITYEVQKGDTLSKIGAKIGIPWKTIAKLNNIEFPYIVRVGQILKLVDDTPQSYMYNGVDYSLVFDLTYYVNTYDDLKKAFGTNAEKLFNHFIVYGMKECRQAHPNFNVNVYKNKYPDLQKAFKNDMPSYYKHYVQYGYKENRVAI